MVLRRCAARRAAVFLRVRLPSQSGNHRPRCADHLCAPLAALLAAGGGDRARLSAHAGGGRPELAMPPATKAAPTLGCGGIERPSFSWDSPFRVRALRSMMAGLGARHSANEDAGRWMVWPRGGTIMRTLGLLGAALMAAWLVHGSAEAAEGEPYKLRGTLVEVNDQLVTVLDDNEETSQVALTKDTRVFAVTPGKWSDIKPGQFVGITSVASEDRRVALEVHIFAEDLRGTGEGHYPWDLIKDPNMMTN